MQTTCTGIFIDNMIRLDTPVDWPSGQAVQVVPTTQNAVMPSEDYIAKVHQCAESFAALTQEDFDDLEDIIAERHHADRSIDE